MLIILLLFSVLNLTSSIPLNTPSGHDYDPPFLFGRALSDCLGVQARYRTNQDIISSCLVTIFACTWVAIHPNLPGPWDSGWTKLKRRVVTMIYAVLAPEFVTVWAMRQWWGAGEIAREFNQRTEQSYWGSRDGLMRLSDEEIPWYMWVPNFLKESWMILKSGVEEYFHGPNRNAPNTWTLAHGFLIQMGGFMLFDGTKPIRMLNFDQLVERIRDEDVDIPDITEAEINDKSKGDFLTKLLVVLQTSWFVVQCLTRWATHLPVTELEVITLAFAALNIITYALWWQKPQNVLVAVRLQLKNRARLDAVRTDGNHVTPDMTEHKESRFIGELKKVVDEGWLIQIPALILRSLVLPLEKLAVDKTDNQPSYREKMFAASTPNLPIDAQLLPLTGIGILFGGLHLIPWSSSFPTNYECWLWRFSALVITAYPLVVMLLGLAHSVAEDDTRTWTRSLLRVVMFVGIILYLVARVALIGLAFASLRRLPLDAYANIEWTTFVPHL